MLAKRWITELPFLLLGALVFFFLCTHSPNLEYDVDPSYILFGPARPPLYPIFIWLFHWAGVYQFNLVMWAQGILLLAALYYVRYWLRKNLQLSDFLIFLVWSLVIFTISFHFQIWFIQSEGLSFPLFIVSFFALVECFYKFNFKKLSYLAFWVSVLVLTRLQFYYFYVLFALLGVWYLWQRIPIKKLALGMIILFGSMSLTTMVDHSYHYFKHGFFAGSPYGGLMILVQTLFLADKDAANYFQDPTEKAYVQTMLNQVNAKNLNQDAALLSALKPSYFQYAYQSYTKNYLGIQDVIDNTLNTSVENAAGKPTNLNANTIALNIDKVLIAHAPKKNFLFLVWKFIECMGGIPQFLFFLILLLALPFKIIKDKIREPNVASVFVVVITGITFLNAAIIALCNPDLPVYFCYSQFMLYCLAAFLAHKVFIIQDELMKDRTCQKFF